MAKEVVRVKLNVARCGHRIDDAGRVVGEFAQSVGEVVEMSPEEAQRNIDRGIASLVTSHEKRG